MFRPKVAFEESTQHSKTSKTMAIVATLRLRHRHHRRHPHHQREMGPDRWSYCAPTKNFTWGMPNLWAFGLLGVQVMENIGKPRQVIPIFGFVHGSATVTTQVCTFQV